MTELNNLLANNRTWAADIRTGLLGAKPLHPLLVPPRGRVRLA